MNQNLKDKIAEIADRILKEDGMVEVDAGYCSNGNRKFRYTPTFRKTYHGTYLNPYSLPYKGDPADKPLRWSDEFATEEAYIIVGPLYRHNGTAEDVNAKLWVSHSHATISEHKECAIVGSERDADFIKAIKEQSPTDYLAKRQFVSGYGKTAFSTRISGKAGAKAINNAVEKAMSAVREFVPYDHSALALNPSDYHESTDAVCNAWIKARKEAGHAA